MLSKEDLRAALPDLESCLEVPGLEGTVTIYRDSYGIPHVRACCEEDAFFGQGFACAQDRLWHMDYDRHRAEGRWAELVGEAGLESDLLLRRMRLEESARLDYEHLDAGTKAMLQAYASGVNAFIQSTRSLPVEYGLTGTVPAPWRPHDSLSVFKVRHVNMGVWEVKVFQARLVKLLGPEDAAALFPGPREGHPLILPPGAIYRRKEVVSVLKEFQSMVDKVEWLGQGDGSNNWAVGGERTASGAPLMAGDPHRALDTPNVYYQNHVACPAFDVVGFSFPGIPGFPHFGHNGDVAWCITHTGADYQDIYIERFEPDDDGRYLYRGEWLDAQVSEETIKVRGGRPVTVRTYDTHHGPVIAGEPSKGYGLALKYSATSGPNPTFNCLLPMMRAEGTRQLEEAVRDWVDPCNSFVFASVGGDIGFRLRGRLPVRDRSNAWLPVPGWTGEHEWDGFLPFEEMPATTNPDTGFIVTANNRVVDDDYPHYIALDFDPGFRARRITDGIVSGNNLTVGDMAAIHADCVSIPARDFSSLLKGLEVRGEDLNRAKELLAAWDGEMDRDKVEPTIYSAFRDTLLGLVLFPRMGALSKEASTGGRGILRTLSRARAALPDMIRADDRRLLPGGACWEDMMGKALDIAVASLKETLGRDLSGWRWGTFHRTAPVHPLSVAFPECSSLLDPPGVPMSGDSDTVRAADYLPGGRPVVSSASAARYVFDLADLSASRWVVPLGSSGHAGSPHFADQVTPWSHLEMVPMLYRWDQVERESRTVQELRPG